MLRVMRTALMCSGRETCSLALPPCGSSPAYWPCRWHPMCWPHRHCPALVYARVAPCALAAQVLPCSCGHAGFVPLQWPCGLRPASVSHVGVVLYGGRMDTSRVCGRMEFVPCVAVWCPEAVIFLMDSDPPCSDIPIGIPMPLMSDYPF